jgi:hypothetical protein
MGKAYVAKRRNGQWPHFVTVVRGTVELEGKTESNVNSI